MNRTEAHQIAEIWCTHKFPYDYPDTPEGRAARRRHIAYDTNSTADEILNGQRPELVAVYRLGQPQAPTPSPPDTPPRLGS